MAMTCISGARECCGCMACLNGSGGRWAAQLHPIKTIRKSAAPAKGTDGKRQKKDIIRIKSSAVHCTNAGGKRKAAR